MYVYDWGQIAVQHCTVPLQVHLTTSFLTLLLVGDCSAAQMGTPGPLAGAAGCEACVWLYAQWRTFGRRLLQVTPGTDQS